MKSVLLKILKFSVIGYIVLFIVFFFDLDGKALFYFGIPALKKHYDKIEREDRTKMPYDLKAAVENDYSN